MAAPRRSVSARRCSRPNRWNAQYGVAAIDLRIGRQHQAGERPGRRLAEGARDARGRPGTPPTRSPSASGSSGSSSANGRPLAVSRSPGWSRNAAPDHRIVARDLTELRHVVAQSGDRVGPIEHPRGAGAVARSPTIVVPERSRCSVAGPSGVRTAHQAYRPPMRATRVVPVHRQRTERAGEVVVLRHVEHRAGRHGHAGRHGITADGPTATARISERCRSRESPSSARSRAPGRRSAPDSAARADPCTARTRTGAASRRTVRQRDGGRDSRGRPGTRRGRCRTMPAPSGSGSRRYQV